MYITSQELVENIWVNQKYHYHNCKGINGERLKEQIFWNRICISIELVEKRNCGIFFLSRYWCKNMLIKIANHF